MYLEPGPMNAKAHSASLGRQRPSPAAVSVESTRNTASEPWGVTPMKIRSGELWFGSMSSFSSPLMCRVRPLAVKVMSTTYLYAVVVVVVPPPPPPLGSLGELPPEPEPPVVPLLGPALVLEDTFSFLIAPFGGLNGFEGSNTPSVEPSPDSSSPSFTCASAASWSLFNSFGAGASTTGADASSAGFASSTGTATSASASTAATGHSRFSRRSCQRSRKKVFMAQSLRSRSGGRGRGGRGAAVGRGGGRCRRRGRRTLRSRSGGRALRLRREVDRRRQLGLDAREEGRVAREVHAVDRHEAAVHDHIRVHHVDEALHVVEEVRQVEEVADELELERHRLQAHRCGGRCDVA